MKRIILFSSILFSIASHANSVNFCKQEVEKSKSYSTEQKIQAATKITESFEVDFYNADNWKMPIDSLKSMSGSLYDLAVLQYFILIDMGFKDEHLKLNYGYSKGFNEPNMSVYIYDYKSEKRYVIDYLSDKILNKNEHDSFDSVYYFDQKSLWTNRGYSGSSDQIKPWREIMKSKDKTLC